MQIACALRLTNEHSHGQQSGHGDEDRAEDPGVWTAQPVVDLETDDLEKVHDCAVAPAP